MHNHMVQASSVTVNRPRMPLPLSDWYLAPAATMLDGQHRGQALSRLDVISHSINKSKFSLL